MLESQLLKTAPGKLKFPGALQPKSRPLKVLRYQPMEGKAHPSRGRGAPNVRRVREDLGEALTMSVASFIASCSCS